MGYKERQNEIIAEVARRAAGQPALDSGLWFHNDIRNNFYYASYLLAAAVEQADSLNCDAEAAKRKASDVLIEVLRLQDRKPDSDTYGHWPLNLGEDPQQAKPNTLPVELMGCLMAYFADRYQDAMNGQLKQAFDEALVHIYQSGFFRIPMHHFNHHEAKYTASKIIFGQLFADEELLADGRLSLEQTLSRLKRQGMSEYGILPWFWHWVQAYTCAWQMTEEESLRSLLEQMLDFLWTERAAFYIGGAWAGAHSRGWPHDIPGDRNVLFDYVQFGDFELPEQMPRTEYAGFLFYEAPASAIDQALNRAKPSELKRLVPRRVDDPGDPLHSYVYLTQDYAVGGIYERIREFDNEQHRWDVTLPLRMGRHVNKAYFFLPAEGNDPQDLRHQAEQGEVLFHQNVVAALYPASDSYPERLRGCLPPGTWIRDETALFGQCGNVFIAFYLMKPYSITEQEELSIVACEKGSGGVIMECLSEVEAGEKGIEDIESFARTMRRHAPRFSAEADLQAEYSSLSGDQIMLRVSGNGLVERIINGKLVEFADYTIS